MALPVEHGGWALLLEPMVLGLVLAPSVAGLLIALAASGAFLARHPFKLVAVDRRRGRRLPRTAVAERFVVLYTLVAVLSLAAALKNSTSAFVLPILIAAPLALIQLAYDAFGRSRSLTPELSGSIAISTTSAAIVLAGGWLYPQALALWVIVCLRMVPTILYVRTRLRLLHHQSASLVMVITVHIMALALMIALARAGVAPFLAIGAFGLLLLRAVIGFSTNSETLTAKKIGLLELLFGGITVLVVALGYRLAL